MIFGVIDQASNARPILDYHNYHHSIYNNRYEEELKDWKELRSLDYLR